MKEKKNEHGNGKDGAGAGKDWHHIFPTSVFPELKSQRWNKIKVEKKEHIAYHALYNNLPPEKIAEWIQGLYQSQRLKASILSYLNKKFWGSLFIVDKGSIRLKKKIQGKIEKVIKEAEE